MATRTFVFDLDGTIALNDHRQHLVQQDPPDWDAFFDACDKDTPNWPLITIIRALWDEKHTLTILSGRSDQVRDKTERWLADHNVPHDQLIMRPEGDYTPDDALKARFLDEYRLSPDAVFDDRDKVVAMWRSLGIPCFQVAPGNF